MTTTYNDLLTLKCPFCGRTVTFGEETETKDLAALHELPTCATYDRLEPDEFVRAVRERLSS